jgi:hypothetical protein
MSTVGYGDQGFLEDMIHYSKYRFLALAIMLGSNFGFSICQARISSFISARQKEITSDFYRIELHEDLEQLFLEHNKLKDVTTLTIKDLT